MPCVLDELLVAVRRYLSALDAARKAARGTYSAGMKALDEQEAALANLREVADRVVAEVEVQPS